MPDVRRHRHWIGGKSEEPSSGAYLLTEDPTTGRPGDEVAAGGASDVERAVGAARSAQAAWAALSAASRSELLHRVAQALEQAREELMELERLCTGKLSGQLRLEQDMSLDYFRYYAGIARAHHGHTIDLGGSGHTYTRLEPYGVVGVITPWNLPLNQACRSLAPALAVGNAVVLKPSELTSGSSVLLARLASEAGLPDGVLNVVTGTGPEAGEALAAHPEVRRVVFTGSVATGRHVATLAADRLVPMTLELGGKSPLVVFADAHLDRAVAAAVSALTFNTGQTCSATSRLLVEESVHDEVVARVVEAVGRLRPQADFGPMITRVQYEKVLAHFAQAAADGLVPAVGGEAYGDLPGFFVQPTVYARVDPRLRVVREEVFGPVLVTMPFVDEADALAQANDSSYGLVASIWSGDVARGLRLAHGIDAGQVSVNGGPLTVETPFGGFKGSGYGREKGLEALRDYAQVKTVSVALG